MTDFFPAISFIDLERLKDDLARKIRRFFHFEDIVFYEWHSISKAVDAENLSQRQAKRAKDDIISGKPFFDRITNRIFLPLEWNGGKIGIAVLSNVNRIEVEEEERWLPLLAEIMLSSLLILKMDKYFSGTHAIPPYVELSIRHMCKKTGASPTSVLILDMIQDEPWEKRLSQLMQGVWPGIEFELIAKANQRFWLLLKGINENNHPSAFKKAFSHAKKKRIRLKGIFGLSFQHGDDPVIIIKNLTKLLDASEFMNASTLTPSRLAGIEKDLQLQDIAEVIDVSRKIKVSGRNFIIGFGGAVSRRFVEKIAQKCEVFATGHGNAFFLQRKRCEPLEWGKELQAIASSLKEPLPTLGMVPVWKCDTKKEWIFWKALMAYLHALLIAKGSLVEYDAITLNVAGDEYFAMGDLINAGKSYHSGLRLEPDNRKLLNSYGVCLAELGQRKRAENSFLKAMRLYPDDFIACYNLGGLYIDQDRVVEAEKVLKKAYELEPDNPRVAIRYAEVLCDAGRQGAAADVLKKVSLEDNDKLYYSYYKAMGMAYYAMPGKWPMARDAFQSAIKLNPSDLESLLFIAKGYLEHAEDKETAMHLFKKAGNLTRNTPRAKKIYKYLSGCCS